MTTLARQRCFHHGEREAAVRCPLCGRFFCRECVTEHEGRLVCRSCLERAAAHLRRRRAWSGPATRAALAIGGVLLAWFFFVLLGAILVKIPADVHQGAVWKSTEDPD